MWARPNVTVDNNIEILGIARMKPCGGTGRSCSIGDKHEEGELRGQAERGGRLGPRQPWDC